MIKKVDVVVTVPDDLPEYWKQLLERGDKEVKLLDNQDSAKYFNNNSTHEEFQFALTKSCKKIDFDKYVNV